MVSSPWPKRGYERTMASEANFWRWYFLKRDRYPIVSIFGVLVWIALLIGIWREGIKHWHGEILLPFITDPFFVLAWAIMITSGIDFDYMRFRLAKLKSSTPISRRLGFSRDETNEFLREYKDAFGRDIHLRFWRVRYVYIASIFIAAVRCLLAISQWHLSR